MRPPPLVLLILSALALGCGDDAPPAPTESAEAEPIDLDDPSECVSCHARVVEEWRTSMHALAHHEADPIYGAMRRLRIGREGEVLAGRCAQCHGPRDPTNPESTVSKVGVGCASCHLVQGIDTDHGRRKGALAITWADGVLRGSHDVADDAAAPHGVGRPAPWLTDGRTICLTCHEAMKNSNGVDTCTTGTEYAAGGSDRTCTDCHMPEVEGPSGTATERRRHRSHAFLGPHGLHHGVGDPSFMASAVTVTGTLEGTRLTATLHNATGHAMPSGYPGRVVVVRATGFGTSGEAVWRNFDTDPMTDDPDAVLNKVYVDEDGAPVLPPYASALARDTRLAPGETRTLRWTVPAEVVRADLVLLYRLVPAPAAAALGIAGAPIAEARPFLTVSVSE